MKIKLDENLPVALVRVLAGCGHRVRSLFEACEVSEWSGSFVVATDHKLRVRKPA